MKTYHVVYTFTQEKDDGKQEAGMGSMTLKGTLDTKNDVEGLQNFIADSINAQGVVIINWIELTGEPSIGDEDQ